MKLHGQIQWNFTGSFLGCLYKNTTRGHDWLTTTTTKWLTSCFTLKNISETTSQNSMKLYRKLPWVTLYKNTTRGHAWSTTTATKWLTSCFALKTSLKLLFQIQGNFTGTCLGWPSTKIQQGVTIDQQQQNGQLPVFSKTTSPNSMKHYRKLPCVTFYKNTTRGRDWLTTTTIWPTSCFV